MKTNHLEMAGILVNDPRYNSCSSSAVFTLVHNFGGNNNPLFLPCIVFLKEDDIRQRVSSLRKGKRINVGAFLRNNKGNVQLVVQTISDNNT